LPDTGADIAALFASWSEGERGAFDRVIPRAYTEMRDITVADERLEPQLARIGLYRGLPVEETAEALGVCTATVKRDRALAKAWLLRTMHGNRPD
jgi:hypothetical protein